MLKGYLLDKFDDHPPETLLFGAGAVASSIAQFVSYPFALVRVRYATREATLGVTGRDCDA